MVVFWASKIATVVATRITGKPPLSLPLPLFCSISQNQGKMVIPLIVALILEPEQNSS